MKKKTRILIVTVIIGISAFAGTNFFQSGNISDISLDDIIAMAMANSEGGTACVTTDYHSANMILETETTSCYEPDGTTKCGIQQCCKYQAGAGDCQETSCVN